MDSLLEEYRCQCGKLLFKGALFLSTIEVKCKRCGTISRFKEKSRDEKVSFTFFLDTNGIIVDACRAVSFIGIERVYLIGKKNVDLFPLLRDRESRISMGLGKHFEIPHNVLLLEDGKTLSIESSFVPQQGKDGCAIGCRVFNVLSYQ